MIVSLALKNFRKHEDLHLEFTPGFNLICGPNWVGKSSILLAITYALFGSKALAASAEELVSFGQSAMSVTLRVRIGTEDYIIERSLKKAQLTRLSDQAVIATGHSPVSSEVESLLGLSARDFLSFHMTRQEDVFSLIALGPSKLSEFISRVTGVDLIDWVLMEIKDHKSRTAGALGALQDRQGEIASEQQELTVLKGTLEQQTKAGESLAQAIAQAQENYKSAAQHSAEALKAYQAYEEAARELKLAEAELVSARSSLEKAELALPAEPPEDPGEVRKRVQELVAEEQRLDVAAAAWATFLEREAAALSSLGQFETAIAEFPVLAEDPSGLLDAAEQEAQVARHRHTQAREALGSGVCPYCERPFEGADPEHLAKLEADAAVAVESANSWLRSLIQQAGDWKAETARQSEIEAIFHSWKAYLEALRATAPPEPDATDQQRLAAIRSEIPRLTASLDVADQAYLDYRLKAAARETASKQAAEAERRLSKVQMPPRVTKEEADQAQIAEREQEREWQSLLNDYKLLQREQAFLKEKLEASEQKLAGLELEQRLYLALRERLEHLKELDQFLRNNRDRFFSSVWEALLGHASSFVTQATRGDVTELKRDAAAREFTYIENGHEMSVAGSASGMQKAIFSTALKLALADFFGSSFGVLFFDEVTAAAGDETSLLFAGLLAKAREQVLFVTHRQEDAAVADNVITL